MAAIQNIEVVVDIDISKAVAELTKLQEELVDLAETIEAVDAGARIDVESRVENIDTELATFLSKVQAADSMANITVGTRMGAGAAARAAGGAAGGAGGFAPFGFDIDTDLDSGRLAQMLVPGFRRRARRTGPLAAFQRAVRDASNNLDTFSLRMSTLHNLLAAFIPALVVLIGALPTVVNALAALAAAAIGAAGALLAIGGLGALGAATTGGQMPSMEDFSEIMTDIRDAFFEAFLPLAERLEPVFLDALDGLERFFQAVVGQGDSLVALVDEVRAFGRFMTDFIPDVLGALAGSVEALAPAFGRLGQFIHEDTQIIRTMTKLTLEALPVLAALADTIVGALPALVEFSTGMAIAANLILVLIGSFIDLFHILGFTNEQLGVLIGTFLTLVTVMAIASFFAQSRLGVALLNLAKIIFTKVIVALAGSTAAFFEMSLAAAAATVALATFITVATLGIGALAIGTGISALTGQFFDLAGGITAATDAMKDFDRVSQGTSNFNPYGSAPRPSQSTSGVGSGGTTVNIETTGDENEDKSMANKAAWRMGRTSGSGA